MRSQATLAVTGLLAVSLLALQSEDEPDGFVEPFPLPDVSLVDLNGNTMTLQSLASKVTIVDFWATWCIPCLKEMPHFEALYNEYYDRSFWMVSLSTDQDPDYVKGFMKEKGLNVGFPILMANAEVRSLFGDVNALPTTFVVDSTGTIVRKYIGFRYRETFENDIRSLLGLAEIINEKDSGNGETGERPTLRVQQ